MKKIFIGIDFSKEKFDATLIKAEGVKECGPSVHEVFDNKTSGYHRLVKWVRSQSEDAPADSLLYCGENTGGYSIGLSNYLYASGYDMWLESAYSIKQSSGRCSSTVTVWYVRGWRSLTVGARNGLYRKSRTSSSKFFDERSGKAEHKVSGDSLNPRPSSLR